MEMAETGTNVSELRAVDMLLVLLLLLLLISITCQAKSEITQLRIYPYGRDLQLLRQEPPLKRTKSLTNRDSETIEELWMQQKVDHFESDESNTTWLMRYYCNAAHFEAGGPMFIFVGGEWEISSAYLQSGLMYDVARQHGGMLYYVEHRYYGQSWPVDNTSLANLQYLNAQQSLADLAHFIAEQRLNNPKLFASKVVLTGGSYSASLVAWFGKLYSHLMNVGWASSAPLLAKMDFYEYMQHVSAAIKLKGGAACHRRLQHGTKGLMDMLRTHSGASQLQQRLHICNNFKHSNEMDRTALYSGIANYFASIVQSYSSKIAVVCNTLLSLHANNMEAFLLYVERIFWPPVQARQANWCIDLSYESMKSHFMNVDDKVTGARQWLYQSCNEFGWFATASEQQPQDNIFFPQQVPLRYFEQLCRDVFTRTFSAHSMAQRMRQTNHHFGALANVSPHIVFTHGQLDPWRAVGLQSGHNVIVIPDYSHTEDLDSINLDDSVEMNVAKLKVAAFLRRALTL